MSCAINLREVGTCLHATNCTNVQLQCNHGKFLLALNLKLKVLLLKTGILFDNILLKCWLGCIVSIFLISTCKKEVRDNISVPVIPGRVTCVLALLYKRRMSQCLHVAFVASLRFGLSSHLWGVWQWNPPYHLQCWLKSIRARLVAIFLRHASKVSFVSVNWILMDAGNERTVWNTQGSVTKQWGQALANVQAFCRARKERKKVTSLWISFPPNVKDVCNWDRTSCFSFCSSWGRTEW